jgi:signal transduction histidine kinase
MNRNAKWFDELKVRLRALLTVEAGLSALTVLMIGAFFRIAGEDRLLLNLYYIGIAGTAYALIKRRAYAYMVFVVSVAGGTTLANVYLTSQPTSIDPLLDPVAALLGWAVLLFICWQLGLEAFRFQTHERQQEVRRIIEEKTIAMRAAALTSTSHEVRTPLSAILAVNETLLNESAGPLTDIQRDFLKDIDEAAQHLMNLVNDILDFAKAEAGMIELSKEPVALPELIEQCIAMVEPKAEKTNVTVSAKIDADVVEIVADPLRVKQILLNLLSNAVKFNEPSGMVNVQVRSEGDNVLIGVRDTGRGISEEQLPHLFDPYYQATRGDQGIGTGLGLSIIKYLTELHGGTISVESVPGTGSIFTVRLPKVATIDTQPTAPNDAQPVPLLSQPLPALVHAENQKSPSLS